jgi:hypothetical protein
MGQNSVEGLRSVAEAPPEMLEATKKKWAWIFE